MTYAHNAIHSIQANKKCWTRPVESTSFAENTACNKPFFRTSVVPENAVRWRFFVFIAGLVPAFLVSLCQAQESAPCQGRSKDTLVRITHVIDGDTVVLAKGEKLRLIGIDTPEIGYKGKASQPGAVEARKFVADLIDPERLYPLIYGIEQQDRYARSLGHLFLEDGQNVQAMLLARGLATPLNIPPNLYYSDCYQYHTNLAIKAKLGIWSLRQYQPMASTMLTGRERGYHIINGPITRIGTSSSSLWINLGRHLAIRITRNDLQSFPGIEPTTLNGAHIEARGMLYSRNKQLRLRLRHHTDLRILNKQANANAMVRESPDQ